MSTGLEANNQTVVSAFHSELLRQGLVVLLILLLVGAAWLILRSLQLAHGGPRDARAQPVRPSAPALPEPAARRLLRISFGLLWAFDGILLSQPKIPLAMGPDVIQPTAAASPAWVQHLDNALVTVWSYHPVTVAAAAVWIQLGIGVWLLVAPRGAWSRLAGVASVLWGLLVWVFGEAFGGIFAPGLTWLFGAPGAALLYCVAGVLVALPEAAWRTPRTGRVLLRAIGAFFLGMAVLQAWPGRGFWQGEPHPGASAGRLTTIVREAAQTPQPHVLSSLLSSFAGFLAADGWEVNLFVVLALATIGALLFTTRPSLVRAGMLGGLVLCLADWVLVEDLGFFGGVGTDPGSMIPMALLFVAGYLAIVRVPAATAAVEAGAAATGAPAYEGARAGPARLWTDPTYVLRSLAALVALAITIVGAAPMAVAATEPHADPIIAEAVDGTPNAIDLAAAPFTLVDQRGREVSLSALRGKAIALTFLDAACTSDCPVIAQEFRIADGLLGADARKVALIAIDANPQYIARDYLVAFDRQEGLEGLPNWLYLTGSLAQLEHVWRAYDATVEYLPGGAMINHSEFADVIDASGRIRYIFDTDPGPATEASQSSFAVTLANALKSAVRTS